MLFTLYTELDQVDKDKWEQFVSGKLAEVNKKNNTDLVCVKLFFNFRTCMLSFIWRVTLL